MVLMVVLLRNRFKFNCKIWFSSVNLGSPTCMDQFGDDVAAAQKVGAISLSKGKDTGRGTSSADELLRGAEGDDSGALVKGRSTIQGKGVAERQKLAARCLSRWCQAKLLSMGISKALITTGGGLILAIPLILIQHLLERVINRRLDQWDTIPSDLTATLTNQ